MTEPTRTRDKWRTSATTRATIGGALAGAVEAFCLHPMDTIKTRLQLQHNSPSGLRYHGILHCGKTIIREEGFTSLYKGLTPFTTHLVIKYALRFYTYTSLTRLFRDPKTGNSSPARNFLAGICAGMLEACCVVTPFEVVKIRLQAQEGHLKHSDVKHLLKYHGPIDAASKIVKEEGLTALWKGLTPTLFRNATNQACNFMTFDLIKRHLWFRDGHTYELAPWQTILTGAFSGAIGPLLNGPADVVKTRLMRQESSKDPNKPPHYRGFLHAIKVIVAEEGFFALYKGIAPRLLRLAPGQAITWTVVEQVNAFFNRMEGTQDHR